MTKAEEAEKKALLAERKAEKELKRLVMALALSIFFNKSLADQKATKIIRTMGDELPEEANPKSIMDAMWTSYNSWLENLVPFVLARALTLRESATGQNLLNKLSPTEKAKLARKFAQFGASSPLVKPTEQLGPSTGTGKKLDSWAATERNVRYYYQQKRLQEELDKGFDLYQISVHTDCSKRCLPDQGKIISKTLPPIDASLWTGKKVDGKKIYSWPAMHARVDKYGWHNFIIDGFNCRHHISPYKGGSPEKPKAKEAAEASEAESSMREAERRLRQLNGECLGLEKIDKARAEKIRKRWISGFKEYQDFASKHGIDPKGWRTQ
jgi:hypothetical protein